MVPERSGARQMISTWLSADKLLTIREYKVTIPENKKLKYDGEKAVQKTHLVVYCTRV